MPFQAVDISRMASAAAIVFDALREAIIEGDLAEGEPLRQDDLARRFGTSRIPVREALTRLEQLGLVTTQRYRGAVVAGLKAEQAREIFDFRRLLETEVTRRAVPRMGPADLAEARRALEAFSASPDPMAWGGLNRAFHLSIYRAAGLPYHLEVINNAMDRVERYLRAQLVMSDGMARADAEHRAILAACDAGKAKRAARLVGAHIDGAKEVLLAHLARPPAGGAPKPALRPQSPRDSL